MHTMHHRKALVPGLSDVAISAIADAPILRKRQKQKKSLFSNSGGAKSVSTLGRNDLIIAVMATFLLTLLVVLVGIKMYTVFITPSVSRSITSGETASNNNNKNRLKNEEADGDDDAALPWNELYRVPNSMRVVGDRSDRYVQLRMETDVLLPAQQYDRSLLAVKNLLHNNPYTHEKLQPAPQVEGQIPHKQHNSDQVMNPTYDIYDCPDEPPEGYPFAWNMMHILKNWPTDDVTPPSSGIMHQGLCVFDYQADYNKAMTYRHAELPFVVVNDPAVAETVERWNSPGYLQRLMGSAKHRTEYSENNHFMYYVPPSPKRGRNGGERGNARMRGKVPADWKAPTQLIRMSYGEWLSHANVTDDTLLGPDHPHWYYRLIGCGGTANDGSCDKESSEYLFDELTFFQPRESQLYIVDPDEQKGIHCRFGMKGVIAENHFDGSRNAIVVLGGSRRYILAHPNQCESLALYPKGHPSSRHSAVDWSNPSLNEFPQFANAMGNEIVLTAGQVLYLPTEWFHFIVSLELNFQCNTRSGITKTYRDYIHQCGF
jgi:Cupin-like domain